MKKVDYCVCCGSKNVDIFPGTIASFVYNRMLGNATPVNGGDTGYLHCLDCDFSAAQIRFERDEEIRYYQNYMKDEYISHRCQYEGEGMRNFLTYLSISPDYIEMRKSGASSVLKTTIDCASIKSVLDYGGDTGNMIPEELLHAKRYITDVQVRELNNGVIAITDPSELDEPVDLVICGHTMEHVSYPNLVIEDMKKYMRSGTWLYLEVPNEFVTIHEPGRSFHEHINLWNLTSLEALLKAQGFEDLEGVILDYPHAIGPAFAVTGRLK